MKIKLIKKAIKWCIPHKLYRVYQILKNHRNSSNIQSDCDFFAADFAHLPEFETVVIIINVNTHLSTTLALFSAIKHTDAPCIIIDCSSNNNEMTYFQNLKRQFSFYLFHLPLNAHGVTLDFLFRNIKADNILLLDSDAEITDFSFFKNDIFNEKKVFGIGFIHGPCPMLEQNWIAAKFMYYQERMHIPCVLLKRNNVIEALDAGCSFMAKEKYNDFPVNFIAHIFYERFLFPCFQKHDFPFLKFFRRTYYDYFKPSMIYYDTGAEVYCYLKYKCCYNFIGMSVDYHTKYYNHYHGITRKILNLGDSNSTDLNDVENLIRERLFSDYGFDEKLGGL
jgi:hypothetical protein